MTEMDENGEILLLHASKNNAGPFVLPFYMTLDRGSYWFMFSNLGKIELTVRIGRTIIKFV